MHRETSYLYICLFICINYNFPASCPDADDKELRKRESREEGRKGGRKEKEQRREGTRKVEQTMVDGEEGRRGRYFWRSSLKPRMGLDCLLARTLIIKMMSAQTSSDF